MSTTFSHAGVSTLNGVTKVRFANDQLRVKVLAKSGHKDIDIVQLKHPMSKADAVQYLLDINFDNGNTTVRAALEAAAEKRGLVETPKKQNKTKTVTAPAAANVAAEEDAPF